ncbi:hypothetical protein [Bradyrhizobium sp. ARR65]|uniref:hypothetical protein n=1 Tax=Bradyrhizobium sp. ARR65 TaxID=1040989 RepID=UPI0004661A91|nr:hypothetical protein [Bradyrhizobium sp. ARR65]
MPIAPLTRRANQAHIDSIAEIIWPAPQTPAAGLCIECYGPTDFKVANGIAAFSLKFDMSGKSARHGIIERQKGPQRVGAAGLFSWTGKLPAASGVPDRR